MGAKHFQTSFVSHFHTYAIFNTKPTYNHAVTEFSFSSLHQKIMIFCKLCLHLHKTSPPQSHFGRAVLLPSRQRMDSPTVCASCHCACPLHTSPIPHRWVCYMSTPQCHILRILYTVLSYSPKTFAPTRWGSSPTPLI